MKLNQLGWLVITKIKEYWLSALLFLVMLLVVSSTVYLRQENINKQKKTISTLEDRIDDLESKVNDLENEISDLEDNQRTVLLFP